MEKLADFPRRSNDNFAACRRVDAATKKPRRPIQHWRYIRYADGSEELYDHRTDDQEFHNLAGKPEYADTIRKLASHLPETDAPSDPMQ